MKSPLLRGCCCRAQRGHGIGLGPRDKQHRARAVVAIAHMTELANCGVVCP
jgi:hypothetical protein